MSLFHILLKYTSVNITAYQTVSPCRSQGSKLNGASQVYAAALLLFFTSMPAHVVLDA